MDTNSDEQSALITGKNIDSANPQDFGSLKLFNYDSATGQGTEIFDFNVYGNGSSFSVFYENGFVYIGFTARVQGFDDSKEGLRVWRAIQDGNANFVEIFTDPTVFSNNTITNIDIDDDGNTDFLVGGASDFGFNSNKVLHNNGNGTFTMIDSPAVVTRGNSGDFQSGYLDDSGKKHLVTVTIENGGQTYGKVIENQGNGNFVQVFDLTNFPNFTGFSTFPDIEIIDIDNDGLNDISVASLGGTKIYKNLGNLNFQLFDTDVTGLPAVYKGVVKYADFNGDGLPDAVVSGTITQDTGGNSTYASGKILFQGSVGNSTQGNLQFGNPYQLMVPAFEFPDINPEIPLGLGQSDIDFYDVNDDGEMDILIIGNYSGGVPGLAEPRTYLFTNTTTMSVDAFNAPEVVMYPNPARDTVSFTVDQGSITAIEIYNMAGRRMGTYTESDVIHIASLPTGMYLVQIHMDNGSREVKKLLKE